jgi:hypothetical protein
MADAGKQSKAPKGQASDVRYILKIRAPTRKCLVVRKIENIWVPQLVGLRSRYHRDQDFYSCWISRSSFDFFSRQ